MSADSRTPYLGTPRSDALAETATAVPSEPQAPSKDGLPATIGRYQIRSLLGQGGMGVVYAAHDPDLDRRVALKVLRGIGSDPARARLLREARAMAKLSHPSVVTVHEVGSANGVDYVAMELIDGSTVAEWIERDKPAQRDILAAYESAGKGVACAHEAGLVHRDFKPHNVLRSKAGRVVVTDFGLARATFDLDVTLPAAAATVAIDRSAGSLSSTLTATGAVLGTPAYMAPEQHDGGTVGPAADQFAYCVAMWESLSGSRPFKGATMAAVREAIDRGPDPVSEAKIPRRLRAPLRRGMSVDPRKRFASIDELLVELHGRSRRRWLAVIPPAIAVVATAAFFLTHDRHPPEPPAKPVILAGCGNADTELADVVNAPVRAKMATTPDGKRLAAHFDQFANEWRLAQKDICAHPDDPKHAQRAACLVGVRTDLHRVLSALDLLTPEELVEADPSMGIGDAATCQAKEPPARVAIDDAETIAYVAAANGEKKRRDALVEPGLDKPCLRGTYAMAKLRDYRAIPIEQIHKLKEMALASADQCHDDRFAASVTGMAISTDIGNAMHDPEAPKRIEAAIARSGGDRTLRMLEELVDGLRSQRTGNFDEEIQHFLAAADLARERGGRTLVGFMTQFAAGLLESRGRPGDIDKAAEILRGAIAESVTVQRPDLQRQLFRLLTAQGKRDEALAVANAIVDPPSDGDGFIVEGKLVDERGAPIAGARVLASDSITFYGDDLDPIAPAKKVTVTKADGTFSLTPVLPTAWVIASAPDGRRSQIVKAAPKVALKALPTAKLTGRVKKVNDKVGTVELYVTPDDAAAPEVVDYRPPLAADGSWQLSHVPVGKASVLVSFKSGMQVLHARVDVAATAKPIETEVTVSGAPLDVVVRSEVAMPLQHAPVWIFHAPAAPKKIGDISQIHGLAQRGSALPMTADAATPAVRAVLRTGDVVGRVMDVAPGPAFACAYGSSADLNDRAAQDAIEAHRDQLALGCVPITVTGKEQAVVVTVPAAKRFD